MARSTTCLAASRDPLSHRVRGLSLQVTVAALADDALGVMGWDKGLPAGVEFLCSCLRDDMTEEKLVRPRERDLAGIGSVGMG